MTKWIHAPLHLFNETGTYMVIGSTLNKEHFFTSNNDLDNLQNLLLELSKKYQWKLEAWAIFSNHYHFIAHSPDDPKILKKMITHLHASSARELNKTHEAVERTVWYQFWDNFLNNTKLSLNRFKIIKYGFFTT
jgi:putative transposase